ncbi:BtrH N-terminal domain-containing protein [Halofilum ochraceum]|uniref:BtrH N-terminal domain-containing protein n=1 Tax=Halofilum ochraceum TaxID=1611323 RepID=UPI00082C04A9|nr:BtrH N-terminal domain-containing protein [Halofilum ochraceum]
MNTVNDFRHLQSAHCESGVVSSMLTHHGLPISEPMAFGLANALTFAYLPIIKIGGMPLIAYRMPPRWIISKASRRIGARFVFRKFRDADKGMAALDELLDAGRIVGVQASVYWLPFFPEEMRFHFNAHNLIVYGRDGDDYLISDPVFEEPVRCPRADLRKARFTRGAMAANGLLYYPERIPEAIDYERVIPKAIKANERIMNRSPLPIIGIRGIRYLANNLVKSTRTHDGRRRLPLYLAHIVRMQEEIGTGGAGFRFVYASFLQEAADTLGDDRLAEAAQSLTAAGDGWREFAVHATKVSRRKSEMEVAGLADVLRDCAEREADVWKLLRDYGTHPARTATAS